MLEDKRHHRVSQQVVFLCWVEELLEPQQSQQPLLFARTQVNLSRGLGASPACWSALQVNISIW